MLKVNPISHMRRTDLTTALKHQQSTKKSLKKRFSLATYFINAFTLSWIVK